jgi:hypothetical protein
LYAVSLQREIAGIASVNLPRCRERHTPGEALEQRDAQTMFEIVDLPAEGRRGDVEHLARLAD